MEANPDSTSEPNWRDNVYTIPNVISIARLGAYLYCLAPFG